MKMPADKQWVKTTTIGKTMDKDNGNNEDNKGNNVKKTIASLK